MGKVTLTGRDAAPTLQPTHQPRPPPPSTSFVVIFLAIATIVLGSNLTGVSYVNGTSIGCALLSIFYIFFSKFTLERDLRTIFDVSHRQNKLNKKNEELKLDATERETKLIEKVQAGYGKKLLAADSFLDWDCLKLTKILSSGGFGSVYKATYEFGDKGKEVVAVKILLRAKIDVDMLREFVNEIALMQKLRHPNIIACLGTVWHSPYVGAVMEIAERGSLLNVLRDSRLPLQISDRVRLAAEIAKGMSYLHSFDPPIIHRDIKSGY